MSKTQYSGTTSIAMPVAVWLASDFYDHSNDANTISVTSLIKPVRQLVLGARAKPEDVLIDLSSMAASRIGTAIHDSIERSWLFNYAVAMASLGIPEHVIGLIRINPDKETLKENPDLIPVYLEQRLNKQVGKYTISGKFDVVMDGKVQDFKSCKTWTYMNQSNVKKYAQQGSMYRWLNPEIILQDVVDIHYIFTNWEPTRAATDEKYPKKPIITQTLNLASVQETDSFIKQKLNQIDKYMDAPEADIPLCTDEDLWRSAPVFKYYKNPAKTTRSTKNFDTRQEAYVRMAEDGGVGIVIEQPGTVTACKYCQAFSICTQKDALIAAGDLIIN